MSEPVSGGSCDAGCAALHPRYPLAAGSIFVITGLVPVTHAVPHRWHRPATGGVAMPPAPPAGRLGVGGRNKSGQDDIDMVAIDMIAPSQRLRFGSETYRLPPLALRSVSSSTTLIGERTMDLTWLVGRPEASRDLAVLRLDDRRAPVRPHRGRRTCWRTPCGSNGASRPHRRRRT